MIVIDAGHGGSDPGTSGNGIVEKDLALNIAQYLYRRFNELGVPVKIIRTTDETITPDERVKRILDAYGNNPDVVVLSNHLNAGGGNGAEVVYALRNNDTLAKLILDELSKSGQIVRKYYQRRLPSNTNKDYYFIHRNTGQTEPVLIEYGFLDNAEDAQRLKNNYEKYAEAVVRAVAQYQDFQYIPPAGENVYIVQKGDSLYSIARKLGITVAELRSFNNLTSDILQIGQVLLIPIETPSPENTYRVQRGDSLYSIAKKFGISVNDLKAENNLTSNMISIGQILKIPQAIQESPPIEYIEYTVIRGDSLYSIANRFNSTVNEIISLNNLTSNLLQIGQVLKIPTQLGSIPSIPNNPNTNTYTVKSGDSLYSIANRFNTTVNNLKQLNNLTNDILQIGQILIIPSTNSTSVSYIVKSGDNLYSIANRYGVTVNEIKNLNNLTSNILQIGQTLLIPIN